MPGLDLTLCPAVPHCTTWYVPGPPFHFCAEDFRVAAVDFLAFFLASGGGFKVCVCVHVYVCVCVCVCVVCEYWYTTEWDVV